MPSKKAIISGLVVFAIGMFVYNKIPQARRALGGQ